MFLFLITSVWYLWVLLIFFQKKELKIIALITGSSSICAFSLRSVSPGIAHHASHLSATISIS